MFFLILSLNLSLPFPSLLLFPSTPSRFAPPLFFLFLFLLLALFLIDFFPLLPSFPPSFPSLISLPSFPSLLAFFSHLSLNPFFISISSFYMYTHPSFFLQNHSEYKIPKELDFGSSFLFCFFPTLFLFIFPSLFYFILLTGYWNWGSRYFYKIRKRAAEGLAQVFFYFNFLRNDKFSNDSARGY